MPVVVPRSPLSPLGPRSPGKRKIWNCWNFPSLLRRDGKSQKNPPAFCILWQREDEGLEFLTADPIKSNKTLDFGMKSPIWGWKFPIWG